MPDQASPDDALDDVERQLRDAIAELRKVAEPLEKAGLERPSSEAVTGAVTNTLTVLGRLADALAALAAAAGAGSADQEDGGERGQRGEDQTGGGQATKH
ncbi:MAG: hypothetical protein HY294_15580 [Candidatus Rokubacteria bacterium]|nr:hypothetical protein [Candidatus Rokubacteria bacterium]MBI3827414.1 hypothetical protein [Candidatus Rokubacteria bacterium]